MKFATQYDRIKTPPEKNQGERLVNRTGFIPMNKRIESLLLAGERLIQSRSEQYDFPDGNIDYDLYIPGRQRNYDLADATADMNAVRKTAKQKDDQVQASKKQADTTINATPKTEAGGE